jgi:hypothetical protein
MNRDREMMYEQKLKEDQSPGHEGAVGQQLEMKVDAFTLKQQPDKSLFCLETETQVCKC